MVVTVAGARCVARDKLLPGGEELVVTFLVRAGGFVAPPRIDGKDEPGGYRDEEEDVRDSAHSVIIGSPCRWHKGDLKAGTLSRDTKPGKIFRDRRPISLSPWTAAVEEEYAVEYCRLFIRPGVCRPMADHWVRDAAPRQFSILRLSLIHI